MLGEDSRRYTTVFGGIGNPFEKCNSTLCYIMKAKFKHTKNFININFKF